MAVNRRFLARILIAVLSCCAAVAQETARGDHDAKFTSHAALVLIPTLATDRSGHHLKGLKEEDFVVMEDGVEQKIATFEEVTSDFRRLSRRNAPDEFSNDVSGESNPRITLIVLDLLNTPFAAQAVARKELLTYLTQSIDQREPTALYTLTRGGIKIIHDFTTDSGVLVAALRRITGDASQMVDTPEVVESLTGTGTPDGSQGQNPAVAATIGQSSNGIDAKAVQNEIDRLQTMLSQDAELNFQAFQQRVAITYTLEGLQQLAQALEGIPRRKSVIWASGGFPFTVSGDTMFLTPIARDSLTDILPMYEHTWQLLDAAQIALYPVDVKGLQVVSVAPASIHRAGRNYGQNATLREMDIHATFDIFASMTGGRAYYDSNDLVKGFRDAVNDSAEYYVLGYYTDPSKTRSGWRKLKVRVKRDHVEVRARSGFFFINPTDDLEKSRNNDVAIALRSPLDYTSLPLAVQWNKVEPAKVPDKKHVNYRIRVGPEPELIEEADRNHVELEFVAQPQSAEAKDPDHPVGQRIDAHPTHDNLPTILQNGIVYAGALDLSPGEYTVHFVVRDDLSGRLGSVTAPLTVQ
jgi:VWFA-related protein